MRSLGVVLLAISTGLFVATACDRDRAQQPLPSATAQASADQKSAAQTLVGTWQVDGFEAAAASGSASAEALQAAAGSAEALAVRITYTGTQVKVNVPGKPTIASGYTVEEAHPNWVRIKNGLDLVVIAFQDDDHMTIDRKNNPYGAKMRMRRVKGPAPVDVAPSFSVVGKTDAGHFIVKMNP